VAVGAPRSSCASGRNGWRSRAIPIWPGLRPCFWNRSISRAGEGHCRGNCDLRRRLPNFGKAKAVAKPHWNSSLRCKDGLPKGLPQPILSGPLPSSRSCAQPDESGRTPRSSRRRDCTSVASADPESGPKDRVEIARVPGSKTQPEMGRYALSLSSIARARCKSE